MESSIATSRWLITHFVNPCLFLCIQRHTEVCVQVQLYHVWRWRRYPQRSRGVQKSHRSTDEKVQTRWGMMCPANLNVRYDWHLLFVVVTGRLTLHQLDGTQGPKVDAFLAEDNDNVTYVKEACAIQNGWGRKYIAFTVICHQCTDYWFRATVGSPCKTVPATRPRTSWRACLRTVTSKLTALLKKSVSEQMWLMKRWESSAFCTQSALCDSDHSRYFFYCTRLLLWTWMLCWQNSTWSNARTKGAIYTYITSQCIIVDRYCAE